MTQRTTHLTPLVDPPTSGAAVDARWDRDHGGGVPITAGEARRRAARADADADATSARYWEDYAAEVEAWRAGPGREDTAPW